MQYLGGKKTKKVLLASLMVTLILATVFHVNAVSIQEQTPVDEETSGTYDLRVNVIDEYWWPKLIGGIDFAKVVVTHEDDPNFKRVGFSFLPYTGSVFQIPKQYEYPTLNAYKLGWEQIDVHWHSKKEVDIIMSYTGKPRTVNNPFLDNFPLLKQLIQLVLN